MYDIFQLSEPNIVYKLKNIECSTVPGFSANASCHIRAINWNKAVAEMDVYLLRPLYNITVSFADLLPHLITPLIR